MALERKDFIAFAETLKLSSSRAGNLMDSLTSKKSLLMKMVEESQLPDDMKETSASLITSRIASLERISSQRKSLKIEISRDVF